MYVGQGGTSSVDIGVHPVDGGGVKISPGQDGGDGDPGEHYWKVWVAFCTTLLTHSSTVSCWAHRSLVPVWMIMCPFVLLVGGVVVVVIVGIGCGVVVGLFFL